ncbi:hypothetical protein NQ315_008939, partial [Exocentrus adspersus]
MRCAKRKYGVYCAAKNCSSNQAKELIKLVCRARTWVMASDREDLLNDLDTLNESHRLCSLHFEEKMFMNKEYERLLHNAVPTVFTCLEGSSKSLDHTYKRPPLIIGTSVVDVENKENK